MKKNHISAVCCCIAALLGTIVIVNLAAAQTTKSNLVWTNSKLLNATAPAAELRPLVNGKDDNLNAINIRAMRHFKKSFPNVGGEEWFLIRDGYLATFTIDSIKNRVFYNQRGDWTYTVRYYAEKNLPSEVRAIVKSTYYDYAITGIDEVSVEEKTVYLVHIQDAFTWKKLRVCDGEMEILENFNKK
jgi:hypothetical protein